MKKFSSLPSLNKFFFQLLLLGVILLGVVATNTAVSANEPYTVRIEGSPSEEITEQLQRISQLVILEERPPSTLIGLRRRADNDLADLLKVLHSYGYLAAQVQVQFDTSKKPLDLTITITPGELFTLDSVKILPAEGADTEGADTEGAGTEGADCNTAALDSLSAELLPFPYGKTALPAEILAAEAKMLGILADRGFPFATISKRDAVADSAKLSLNLVYFISTGPEALFGPTTITGNKQVKEELIRKKIAWCEGSRFNAQALVKTQQALEGLALFITTEISFADHVEEDNSLPLTIHVVEGKMRTIGAGISYMNDPGFKVHQVWQRFGINGAWQHRNIRGIGEKLSLETNIGWKYYDGLVRYVQPEFFRPREDLIWLAEATHDTTTGYTESYLAISGTLERKVSKSMRFSYGLMFKRLISSHFEQSDECENKGRFTLVKVPLQLHWSSATNLLDPVDGHAVALKSIPSCQVIPPHFTYWINTLAYSFYKPLRSDDSVVLAVKATAGSIWGARRRTIPAPERFYAGSDTLLRGYRYKSVSPLGRHHRPVGGLSMFVLSTELRLRPKERLGWVFFYEVGNVYEEVWPKFRGTQLQSAGIGLRYPTPIGPIRADLAFPLNRRHKIDSAFQLYFSIGQTF